MQNDRNRYISIFFAISLHVILALLLLWMEFNPTPPPFPEPDGILITFGEDVSGNGKQQVESQTSSTKVTDVSTVRNITQNDEEAPALYNEKIKPKKQLNKSRINKEISKEPKEKINEKALFPSDYKVSTNHTRSSFGNEKKQGKQGDVKGSIQASSPVGQGRGLSGISYSLGDRRAVGDLPSPHYPPGNIEGKVVVNIKVDRNGNVISATAPGKGSTTANLALIREAKKAAYKAKFTKDLGSIEQVGTITYHFKLH
jgi:TonB family protein